MLKGSRRQEREREKNRRERRERRRKKNRKYGQAKQLHARRGISSCISAGVVFAVLIAMITVSFAADGKAPAWIGGFALAALIGAFMGIITGFRGFRERDKNYITCKIGIACNIVLLAGFAGIFIRGLI